MNFLVFFPIIATAMAASIPLEGSSVTGTPSLIHSFPVAAEGRQNFGWISGATGSSIYLAVLGSYLKDAIKLGVIQCAFFGSCYDTGSFDLQNPPTVAANLLASLNPKNSAIPDLYQKNRFDESVTQNYANQINQRSSFPLGVPALWNPYVNTPLFARQNEMSTDDQPPAGRFIPYFNSFARFSDPSFVNGVAHPAKVLIPASTVLVTTPY